MNITSCCKIFYHNPKQFKRNGYALTMKNKLSLLIIYYMTLFKIVIKDKLQNNKINMNIAF